MRNKIIFQGKSLGVNQDFDQARLNLAEWTKAKWPDLCMNLQDIIHYPNNISIPVKLCQSRTTASWIGSPPGVLKFNMDGSVLGKPGPAGIGGILRDHMGLEKIRFSKSVGIEESNMAKLLAIREAFILLASSQWAQTNALIVESDSRNAVNWIIKPELAPWRVRKFISHIENLKLQIKEWDLVHEHREKNQVADYLAKEGVNRADNLLVINEE
ncbi:hypothetical protein DITRI_Ditri01bG0164000 [Diplodiscus trichospermus]